MSKDLMSAFINAYSILDRINVKLVHRCYRKEAVRSWIYHFTEPPLSPAITRSNIVRCWLITISFPTSPNLSFYA